MADPTADAAPTPQGYETFVRTDQGVRRLVTDRPVTYEEAQALQAQAGRQLVGFLGPDEMPGAAAAPPAPAPAARVPDEVLPPAGTTSRTTTTMPTTEGVRLRLGFPKERVGEGAPRDEAFTYPQGVTVIGQEGDRFRVRGADGIEYLVPRAALAGVVPGGDAVPAEAPAPAAPGSRPLLTRLPQVAGAMSGGRLGAALLSPLGPVGTAAGGIGGAALGAGGAEALRSSLSRLLGFPERGTGTTGGDAAQSAKEAATIDALLTGVAGLSSLGSGALATLSGQLGRVPGAAGIVARLAHLLSAGGAVPAALRVGRPAAQLFAPAAVEPAAPPEPFRPRLFTPR